MWLSWARIASNDPPSNQWNNGCARLMTMRMNAPIDTNQCRFLMMSSIVFACFDVGPPRVLVVARMLLVCSHFDGVTFLVRQVLRHQNLAITVKSTL